MTIKSKRAITKILATLVLITLILVVAVATVGYYAPRPYRSMETHINCRIYAPSHNIGVLNEEALFDVSVVNYENFSKVINIIMNAESHVLTNETFVLNPISSQNRTITQKLVYTGLWVVEVSELLGKSRYIIETYSFVSVINKVEADMKITQYDETQFNKTMLKIAIAVSLASFAVSLTSLYFTWKRTRIGRS